MKDTTGNALGREFDKTMNKAIVNELKRRLWEIYNDWDFVMGILCIAHGDKTWGKLLSFLEIAEEVGDQVSSDLITAVALKIGKEYGDNRNQPVPF